MSDPDTMDYNRGYDLDFPGYDRETGCIPFPEEDWREWYDFFVGQEPQRFYAYVCREDGGFIGEVNLHRNEGAPWYEMGVLLEARHRSRGYSLEALELLLRHAFEGLGADAVHNDFEETRQAALKVHLNAGFQVLRRQGGIVEVLITREDYRRKCSHAH